MNERKSFQSITQKEKIKSKNGITLIALVISIIVMLILAGVSLNAIIGDNGIITQAQNATYMQSVAVLEEFMQQQYVENYDIINQYENKLDGFISDSKLRNYFQKSLTDSYYFIDSNNYKEYYLIEKSALPEEIRNQLKGGDTSISGTGIYAKFNDVYGITSDLKVYYCSNGSDTRIGAEDDAKESDLSTKVVISASDKWSNALGYNKDVTLEDLRSQTELNITENNLDLKKLAFFGSLQKITFTNVSYDSLDGIEDAPNLYYVFFSDECNINDYKGIGKIAKLKYLYLWNTSDREINKIFSADNGIASFAIPTLQYLAISRGGTREICQPNTQYGYTRNDKVTDISSLQNLNQVTKDAIKYISLECNRISSIESLKDYTNVYLLKVANNDLNSLKGIENMHKLTYLIANNNLLGTDIENTETMNTEQDSLASISKVDISGNDISRYTFTSNMPNLYMVDLSNNENLVWCNYLKDCNKIKQLTIKGCTKLNGIAVKSINEIINNCITSTGIDSRYALSLLDANTNYINLSGLELEKSIFESLKEYTQIKQINMKNLKIIENGLEIQEDELNKVINDVLSNYSNATHIGLEGITKLKDISFVKNTTNLRGIDLRGTNVTTSDAEIGLQLLNDNVPNLKVLIISNENIDLSEIQKCINKLNNGSGENDIFGGVEYGLVCYNNTSLKTLEKCTEITQLKMGYQSTGTFYPNIDLNLSKCENLKSICLFHITLGIVKLPQNIETISHLVAGDSKLDASACDKLKTIEYSVNSNLEFLLNTIQGKSELNAIEVSSEIDVKILLSNIDKIKNCTGLKSISISQVSWTEDNVQISSLNNINELSTLENLSINKIRIGNNDFSQLKGLSNLKNLTITNTNLNDISFMSGLHELQTANLSNNQITRGIYSLSNLNKLESLNLSNNTIFDISSNNGTNYNNLEVLSNINYAKNGSLKALYLEGNSNITDWSYVSKCTWPNGKSGF